MPKVVRQIVNLVYHSNGGFGWTELYHDVPVYIRQFMVRELNDIRKEEKKQMEKGQQNNSSPSQPTKAPDEVSNALEQMSKDGTKPGESPFNNQQAKQGKQQNDVPQPPPQGAALPDRGEGSTSSEEPPPGATKADGDPAKADDLGKLLDKLDN